MQWKMARPSRLSDRFNHWALRHGFPPLMALAPRLSKRAGHFGARLVIGTVMGLYRSPHRAIDRNLARILDAPQRSQRVRAARRQMIRLFGYSWIDLFRLSQLGPQAAFAEVGEIVGREHLEQARSNANGVILLTAHLGCWEMGGVFLKHLGLPLSVVYVPDAFADVEEARRRLREVSGVEEIAIQPGSSLASLPVLRALRAGRIVAMQGDRDFNDRGAWADFLGAPAPFPRGPFHLARMTGAALVPCFIAYSTDLRFSLVLEPPITVGSTADREADVREAISRWVPVLEGAVRRWPTQWFTFYDFWPEAKGVAPSSTEVALAAEGAAGAAPR
jgi:KDO2-lipid IV(A) lauroyltransferase